MGERNSENARSSKVVNMKQIKTRNDFPRLLEEMGLTTFAAEIGVAEGYFSYNLLDHWSGTLWQIDPWAILDTPGFSGHGEATNAEQEARYERIMKRAEKYRGRCLVFRDTSKRAVPYFKDGFFDFVYIDAIHTYESSQEDILLWHTKVVAGGILAGHDYLDGIFQGQSYGVKRAVDEFAKNIGKKVLVTKENDWPSWYIQL